MSHGTLTPILHALSKVLTSNVVCRLRYNAVEARYECEVGGFYKHDVMTVYYRAEAVEVIAEGRYGGLEVLSDPDAIISLNYAMWMAYEDRGWAQPDSAWVPLLIAAGYIKPVTEVRYKAK